MGVTPIADGPANPSYGPPTLDISVPTQNLPKSLRSATPMLTMACTAPILARATVPRETDVWRLYFKRSQDSMVFRSRVSPVRWDEIVRTST